MNGPTVSIAIPLYNKADFIADAVRTALAQTFSDHEIIVLDDGSTDGSVTRLRMINDPRLRLIRQDNAGVAAARTRAMREGRGKYVAFLDADDLWHPEHLYHLLQMASRFPHATLFGNQFAEGTGNASWIGDSCDSIRYRLVEDYFAECANGRAPLYTSSCMVLRRRALELGGFPIGNYCGEDLALWILLAADAPVAVSNFVGCHYRRGIDSLTVQSSFRALPDIAMLTLSDLSKRHEDWPPGRKQSIREYYFRLALAHCLDCLRAGETEQALKYLQLASPTQKLRRRFWLAGLLASLPQSFSRFAFKFSDMRRV